MQRNVTSCDACKADGLDAGHAVLTIGGERGSLARAVPPGRNSLDLCDGCAAALGAWLAARGTPPAPAPAPSPAPVADAGPPA
jgi:hypothetical protein